MADHLGYIRHYSDISNYDVNFEVTNMMQKVCASINAGNRTKNNGAQTA